MGAERMNGGEAVPEPEMPPRPVDVRRIVDGIRLAAGIVIAYGAVIPVTVMQHIAEMKRFKGPVTQRICDGVNDALGNLVGWVVGEQIHRS